MRESHACRLKTSISSCSKTTSFHFRFVMYYFFALYNNRKSFQILQSKCSKVVGTSSDIFGNVWKSSENRWKSSEVARTFSEIPVVARQQSHAFDSEKVGRYTITRLGVISGLSLLYWFSSLLQEAFSWCSCLPLSSKTNISNSSSNSNNCKALYHEPLAWEIAQALPMLY